MSTIIAIFGLPKDPYLAYSLDTSWTLVNPLSKIRAIPENPTVQTIIPNTVPMINPFIMFLLIL